MTAEQLNESIKARRETATKFTGFEDNLKMLQHLHTTEMHLFFTKCNYFAVIYLFLVNYSSISLISHSLSCPNHCGHLLTRTANTA